MYYQPYVNFCSRAFGFWSDVEHYADNTSDIKKMPCNNLLLSILNI